MSRENRPPSKIRKLMNAVTDLDRMAMEENGGKTFRRPYIPGEMWPKSPQGPEALCAVEVAQTQPGRRSRALLECRETLFTEEERRDALEQVERFVREGRVEGATHIMTVPRAGLHDFPVKDDLEPKRTQVHQMLQGLFNKTNTYHAHLDVCDRCRNKPWDLCPVGAQLLTQEAGKL